ncbi:hypothetical protein [Halorhodospira halochloris]|uniref:hypothetical protein n=1 Tax=Halorhodospira halochloris TaxID=1052 RepID=UPI001EE88130|nr:hypothetical protein [Halorhodospira halochloris]MCG5549202.1 hypothetical protein [Halorhodospira halochloris]
MNDLRKNHKIFFMASLFVVAPYPASALSSNSNVVVSQIDQEDIDTPQVSGSIGFSRFEHSDSIVSTSEVMEDAGVEQEGDDTDIEFDSLALDLMVRFIDIEESPQQYLAVGTRLRVGGEFRHNEVIEVAEASEDLEVHMIFEHDYSTTVFGRAQFGPFGSNTLYGFAELGLRYMQVSHETGGTFGDFSLESSGTTSGFIGEGNLGLGYLFEDISVEGMLELGGEGGENTIGVFLRYWGGEYRGVRGEEKEKHLVI